MIASINAMKHVALLLRQQQAEYQCSAFLAKVYDEKADYAHKLSLMADDYNQVATMLEEHVKLRTIPDQQEPQST